MWSQWRMPPNDSYDGKINMWESLCVIILGCVLQQGLYRLVISVSEHTKHHCIHLLHNKLSLSFSLRAFISKLQKCRLRNTTAEVITGSFWIYWLGVSVSSCNIVYYWPGKELVDYITQYLSSIRERRVIPDVKPGYMKELLPDTAPSDAEDWESIFNDIEKVIMPGVSSYTVIFNNISILKLWQKHVFPIFFPRWSTGRALTCMHTTPVWLHGPPCSGTCWPTPSTVLDSPG